MIKVTQNSNFSNWFQIFLFGNLVDEIKGITSAIEISKKIAKKHKINFICVNDDVVCVE